MSVVGRKLFVNERLFSWILNVTWLNKQLEVFLIFDNLCTWMFAIFFMHLTMQSCKYKTHIVVRNF